MSPAPDDARAPQEPSSAPEIVVGLGGSAGGIDALRQFFAHVPHDTRAAFAVVLHLSPDHDSHLAEVLQAVTPLSVTQVSDRTPIRTNHVYVIPPNGSLTFLDGDLVVTPMTVPEQRHAPVDILFRTLAHAHGANAVGIVLSGTGANGSNGIKWIKEHGGLVLVQDAAEAEFPDMPRHALATGLVDYALPVAAMSDAILRFFARRSTARLAAAAEGHDTQADALRDLMTLLRVRTGHDFSSYKQGTVLRRVARRMQIHSVATIRDYVRFLRDSPEEAGLLLNELLISVTSFFRDAQAYEVLGRRILPQLFAAKRSGDQVRAWVPGCATGEEVYSVAMLLADSFPDGSAAPAIQVFGTDLDERAISIAREAVYSDAEVADVSEDRLRRFFAHDQLRYRVRGELRDLVLFAHHNVIKDPPFSHLDLIVCRNLLIYLNRPAQQRLLETFHFALRPGGHLFLGGSETADSATDLFAPFDRGAHIYVSRTTTTRLGPITAHPPIPIPRIEARVAERRAGDRPSAADLHQRLLEEYAPPSIVVTDEHQIVHVSDSAAPYLKMPGGEPSRDLLKLIRPELRVDLRAALHRALRDRSTVATRTGPVGARDDDRVSIQVRPVLRDGDPPHGFLLILFESDTPRPEEAITAPAHLTGPSDAPIGQLEEELAHAKEQLGAAVEQYESQAQEAKAANEELQAMNEELRSSAEELETSKEELQSVNEELTTVNQELKIKVDELALTNNDFQNFINSTDIGTIFLDRSLRVKLFTPRACDVFHLLKTDVGRPLAHISSTLRYDGLHQDIALVLDRLKVIEREVQADDGRWYLMRALPYRTSDNRIDGVVLTFLEITDRLLAESRVRTSEERLRLLIDSATDYAIFSMGGDGRIDFWNTGAERMFGHTTAEIVGESFSTLFTPEDLAAGAPQQELERARLDGRALAERFHLRRDGTRFYCSGVTTRLGPDATFGFAKIARDLTSQREAGEALAQAKVGLEERVVQRTSDLQAEVSRRAAAQEHVSDLMRKLVTAQEEQRARLARDLHDQLGQQLTSLRLTLERLRDRAPAEDLTRALALIQQIDKEVDFLAWELRPAVLDDLGLAVALPQFVRDWSTHHGVFAEVRVSMPGEQVSREAELTFYRIAQEALNNVAKHAHATRADVLLERRHGSLVMVVEDDGIGFDLADAHRGHGIGMIGMRERASLVRATLEIESSPGNGTSVFLRYPLGAGPGRTGSDA